MCGGDIAAEVNATYGTCDSCGSTSTLPKINDERIANLYNRGNHFRTNSDFDKAIAIYEKILNEDNTEAEAHWGLVISKYGIEYVEDPTTHKRVPTCHRVQLDNILQDSDYFAAIANTVDNYTRELYETEAKKISEIQKGILSISAKEEPYDVFICYKETDNLGRRTQDSAIAQDIYYQLNTEGFKVFFSRITLEDKIGAEYEPYIFAALHSAKVMLVVGTKEEHFNAPWVKNEWSRYLALMKQDKNRMLVPCFKDMSAYDLPDELSMLQSQDMSKIGFVQDLIRGIQKILHTQKAVVVTPVAAEQTTLNANATALLKRGLMALEDGEWSRADGFFEEVLNFDAECAEAYLGKFCATERLHHIKDMAKQEKYSTEPTDANYKKALRFGDENLCRNLQNLISESFELRASAIYIQAVDSKKAGNYRLAVQQFSAVAEYKDSAEQAQSCQEMYMKTDYLAAMNAKDAASTVEEYMAVQRLFLVLNTYSDSIKQAEECYDLALEIDYQTAINVKDIASTIEGYNYAKDLFLALNNYKDSAKQAEECYDLALEVDYQTAMNAKNTATTVNGYRAAQKLFAALEIYKDSIDQAEECRNFALEVDHQIAMDSKRQKNYVHAIHIFDSLSGYKDSVEQSKQCGDYKKLADKEALRVAKQKHKLLIALVSLIVIAGCVVKFVVLPAMQYKEAVALYENGEYEEATKAFVAIDGYKDSQEQILEAKYKWMLEDAAAISLGYHHSIGLKSDGTTIATGLNEYGQCDVENWGNIVSISSGKNHSLGLKSDGTVVAVGNNYYNQCDVESWTDIIFIYAIENYSLGIKSDNTVVTTGYDYDDQYNIENWTNISFFTAADSHVLGLKLDNTVLAAGKNSDGQCDVADWSDIITIAAGENHSIGLKSDGTVVATGDNDNKQCNVEDWSGIIDIAAGENYSLGLKSDGTVIATGNNDDAQCNVADWSDIVAIVAENNHSLGLKSDGTVIATGNNYYGQCNVEDWTDIIVYDN